MSDPARRRGDGVRAPRGPGLRHRLRQLLHVERHAVGARDERLQRLGGHRLPDERRHHLPRLALREPRELERRQVRARRPGRRELRARRRDEEHARRGALRDDAPEQLQRRGVAPVQVLDQQHERLDGAEREIPLRQQLHGLPALHVRIQRERRRRRQAEEVREQRDVLRRGQRRGARARSSRPSPPPCPSAVKASPCATSAITGWNGVPSV